MNVLTIVAKPARCSQLDLAYTVRARMVAKGSLAVQARGICHLFTTAWIVYSGVDALCWNVLVCIAKGLDMLVVMSLLLCGTVWQRLTLHGFGSVFSTN